MNAAELSSSEYAEVIVSLDSVIFDDGLVLGPDEIDVVRQAADAARAAGDTMREFLDRAAQDPESLRQWLRQVARDRGHFDKATVRLDYYKEGAANTAHDILALMDLRTKDQCIAAIQRKLSAPPPPNQPHR